ncbi:hypothetical protein Tco_1081351 [Tanacetum coccineum]|uniref:Uncharacterized protein n=1 Tax=Tanacetum coccineum TaxID=301880 RepID=A0ABQ5HX75_9ASTR
MQRNFTSRFGIVVVLLTVCLLCFTLNFRIWFADDVEYTGRIRTDYRAFILMQPWQFSRFCRHVWLYQLRCSGCVTSEGHNGWFYKMCSLYLFTGDDENYFSTTRDSLSIASWQGDHTQVVVAAMPTILYHFSIRKFEPHLSLSYG